MWILYTTPIQILVFTLTGFMTLLLNFKKDKTYSGLTFVLFLCIPILRVSMPGTNIYGGIRQIMEYIPAMAIIAGIGVGGIVNVMRRFFDYRVIIFVLLLPFIFIGINLYKIHPNENAYFNSLAGGLALAKEKNIPSWGNTFGAAYREALVWINKNVEPKAKLALVYELNPNIPLIWIRPDINLSAINRSGYLQGDEYALTLTYQGTDTRSYYDSYLETFLNPVYESRIDGIGVVKVWKNSPQYLKKSLADSIDKKAKLVKTDLGIRFDLGNVEKLSRLELTYNENQGCTNLKDGRVQISPDAKTWTSLYGDLPDDWRISYLGEQPKGGKFIEPFVGQNAQFIDISISPRSACLMNIKNYSVYVFRQ